jgi:hypothetical protein
MTDYSLWPDADGPASGSADASVVLGTEFYVTAQAWLKALTFWRADTTITGPVTGRVYTRVDAPATNDPLAGSDISFALSGTGEQVALLDAPVELTVNQRYVAACLFPSGYSATGGYWRSGDGSSGIVNGPLRAPSESTATANAQGLYLYTTTLTFPLNASPNGASYWVGVIVTDEEPGEGGPESPETPPDETFAAGPLRTPWTVSRVHSTWSAGPLSAPWSAGRLRT